MYEGKLPATIQAYVAEMDGKVVGIGGIAYVPGKPVLFSKMKDELRPYKKFILQSARELAAKAKAVGAVAIANPKESLSCKLLHRIGMTWADTTPDGEAYTWQNR